FACVSDQVSLGEGEGAQDGTGSCVLAAGGVVEGDVDAATQTEIEQLAGCKEITGGLRILASPATNLAPLASLRVIRGSVLIASRDLSEEIDEIGSFDRLERIGGLTVVELGSSHLPAFPSLKELRRDPLAESSSWFGNGPDEIYIYNCPRLVDLA